MIKIELTLEEVQTILEALALAASETPSRSREKEYDELNNKIRGQMVK